MLHKIFKLFWHHRRQFIRYAVVGTSGTVLDLGLLIFTKEILNFEPVPAVAISQILVIVYIFCLNKYWSFKTQGLVGNQLIRFLLLLGFNYLFAVFWMWFWNTNFSIHYLLIRISGIMLSVAWNFILYKYWIFTEDKVCIRFYLKNKINLFLKKYR